MSNFNKSFYSRKNLFASFLLNIISFVFKIFLKPGNQLIFSFLSFFPGNFALILRSAAAKNAAKKIGRLVLFEKGIIVRGWNNLEVGDHCFFNTNSYINAEGGLTIGNNVMVAYYTKIISDTHSYNDIKKPMIEQDVLLKEVKIDDDVWICTGAVITCGIEIKKGCIIGANSVVTKSTEKYGVYGGIPAKLLKKRT